ncbi:MAG: hypothetical protein H7326_11800 [Bdellovibrionaceae bacterium]|nr:hypothetical protein [Pseudobdellovibrionaceae bacterium]
MLAMQTATPDPMVNAEYMEVAYEVAIRKTIPKTLEDLTKYKSMIPTTNTDAETELKQLESLTNNLNISKLTDPEAIYIYNLYLDYSMKLKTVKSRPEFTDCGLTDSELFAIYFYTMNGYRRLNESLRSPGLDSETNELIRLTSNGLFKLKKYEGIVHRGENVRADRLERMKVGNEIDFPTFTSTSKAEGFMKSNKLNMHSKEGRYIAPLSDIRSEEEVLFMPNSRFRVTEVKGTEIMLEQVVDGAPTLRPK